MGERTTAIRATCAKFGEVRTCVVLEIYACEQTDSQTRRRTTDTFRHLGNSTAELSGHFGNISSCLAIVSWSEVSISNRVLPAGNYKRVTILKRIDVEERSQFTSPVSELHRTEQRPLVKILVRMSGHCGQCHVHKPVTIWLKFHGTIFSSQGSSRGTIVPWCVVPF